MLRSGKVISHIYHMIDCVQHSTSVLIHDLWNPSENNLKKSMWRFFCATFSIKAFFKITVEQHIKTSKGSRSNWMLKDEHKHWKVKTVTSLPHSVYRVYMYKRSDEWLAFHGRLMPVVWIGGKILAAAIHEPAGWRIRHKNFPRIHTSQPARQMSDAKA